MNEQNEIHILQLAAISTASFQNTRVTMGERIDRSSTYWTQAYGDVCRAVDREIREREAKEAALKEVAKLRNACQLFIDWCKTPEGAVTPEVIEAIHGAMGVE